MAKKKLDRYPEETFIDEALKSGRATKQRVGLKNIGKPDFGLQARVEHIDKTHSARLSAALLDLGDDGDLAPVVVFRDPKTEKLMLADGFHRRDVYANLKRDDIPAVVVDGTWEDAVEYAVMCNRIVSLARNKADIRKAMEMLFGIDAWWHRSDHAIAEHIGTSQPTVSRYRKEFCRSNNVPVPEFIADRGGSQRSRATIADAIKDRLGPKIQAYKLGDGGTAYRSKVDGQIIELGTDITEAVEKIKGIRTEGSPGPTPAKIHSWLDVSEYMENRGVRVKQIAADKSILCGMQLRLVGDSLATYTKFDTNESILTAVGRLVVAREALRHSGRMVILVDRTTFHRWDQAKMAAIGKLGIEFSTLYGFVQAYDARSKSKSQPRTVRRVAAMDQGR